MVPVAVLAAFGLFVVLFLVLAVRAAGRSAGPPLKQLALELGVPAQSPLLVERHGRSLSVKYTPGGKNTPPSLRITANVDETSETVSFGAYREQGRAQLDMRPAILLRPETGTDRLGKRLGLNREVQIGDPELDALVYVETDAPDEDVQRTLADDRVRRGVRDLLASGASRIQLDPEGLSAVRVLRRGTPFGAADLDRTAALLAEAASAMPLFKAGQAMKPRSPLTGVLGLVFGAMAMPIMLGLAGHAPLDVAAKTTGIGGGFALWALVVAALVVTLRGRSDSLRRIALLSFAALFAVPAGVYAGLVGANRGLDASPAVDHPTTVTQVWTSRGKNTTYFHVAVASWRPEERTVSLDVSQGFYSKVKAGSRMVVTTHEGRLGWEWVDTFRVAP
jgi:hypothetical protein